MTVVDEPKRHRGLWGALAFVAALLAAAALAASPVFSLIGLFAAVRSGDAAKLERLVDFPAVRGGLKSQIAEAFARPGAGVSQGSLPEFLNQAVDRYVTAQGIAGLIARSKASPTHGQGATVEYEGPSVSVKPYVHYRSLDRFEAGMSGRGQSAEAFSLIFARRDVIHWRLIRVELPPSGLRALAESPADGAAP